jgi:3'-phosphoadenosine 5'-phosphosulfate (PAPS) 3'-phosphatase
MKSSLIKHQVKLSEFLSVCVQLSEHAGTFIKQVHNSGYYGGKAKQTTDVDLEDLYTVADITIQKNIEHSMKQLFPYISVVSEEDPANAAHIMPTLHPD